MSDKRIPIRNSLSYQQTKQTVIVAFLIGLVLSIGQIVLDYFSEQAKLSKSITNILETANSTAFHAAYNIDETGAQQITQGLVSNIPIVEATIIDNFGAVLGTASSEQVATSQLDKWVFGSPQSVTRMLHNASVHDQDVGELRIIIDPSLMADSFIQRAGVVFASGILRNTILALAIFAVFYLTFTRSILRAAMPILRGRDQMQLEMPDNHKDDEIGALITSFNDHLAIIEEQNQQIRENNSNLEALVLERTEQLEQRNEELELERKLAIEASMAKSDFLAMMSHEIRTPMNGILGMAELLANHSKELEKEDSNAGDYIDAILESSKSMLALMNSVLDYSKYDQQQIIFAHSPFELRRLINSIVFLLSASAEQKHVILSVDISQQVPEMLTGDAEKLRQVLLNLITNAIKFTEQGFVKIKVALANEAESTNPSSYDLRFTVQDTGIGIEAEEVEQIFEPYTQANASISRHYGGTGMGLAICRAIIEQQDGRIWCESIRDKGSNFIFELPFSASQQSTVPADHQEQQDHAIAIKPLRVLVTDDLAINRKLLKGQLEVDKHSVFLAEGGTETLSLIKQHTVDVVLLDLHMPSMDGIETAHRIRESRQAALPIIGVTANISEQKIEECLAAGMNLVISKPVDQAKLSTAIRQVMDTEQTAPDTIPSEAGSHSPFDKHLIEQHLQMLGHEKFKKLYQEARESALQRAKLLDGNVHDDFLKIVEDAHALAGLCANFGLTHLAEQMEQLEQAAKDEHQLQISTLSANLAHRLEDAFDSVQLQFKDQFLDPAQ